MSNLCPKRKLFLSRGQQYKPGQMIPGGCLNKKDGLTRYGDSHIKDKTT